MNQALMFPKDLSKNRYIIFDFYRTNKLESVRKTVKDFIWGLGGSTKNISQGGGAASEVKSVIVSGIDVAESIYDTISTEVTTRIDNSTGLNTAEVPKTIGVDGTYVDSFFLPLTNELTEGIGHQYDQTNGALTNTLNHFAGDGVSAIQSAINNISSFTGSRNLLLNPDYVQMYKGTGLRSLSLSWMLMPDSKEEAEDLFEIIRRFKEYSAPELSTGNALLLSPLFCAVTFTNTELNQNIRTTDMVISTVSVNYSSEGFMEAYYDGTPKAIKLDIGLSERTMRTQKDWLPIKKDSRGNSVVGQGEKYSTKTYTRSARDSRVE